MGGGRYRGSIYYKDQPTGRMQPLMPCKKCLQPGHRMNECTGDWVCSTCNQPGHKRDQCTWEQDDDAVSTEHLQEGEDATEEDVLVSAAEAELGQEMPQQTVAAPAEPSNTSEPTKTVMVVRPKDKQRTTMTSPKANAAQSGLGNRRMTFSTATKTSANATAKAKKPPDQADKITRFVTTTSRTTDTTRSSFSASATPSGKKPVTRSPRTPPEDQHDEVKRHKQKQCVNTSASDNDDGRP